MRDNLWMAMVPRAMHCGLTLSDAIRMMLLRTVQEKAIPFIPAKPNAATIRALKNSQKGQGKRFNNVEDLLKHLNA